MIKGSVLKLTDLIEDCLEQILENLELSDLIAVAKLNRNLNCLACKTFSRKFGGIEQTLNKIPKCGQFSGKETLYAFGHLITKIRVWPINNDLIDYCCRRECDNREPFPKLKSLSFEVGNIKERNIKFREWFPVLESLSFNHVNVMNPKCIEIHLPALQELSISNNFSSANLNKIYKYFSNDNIKNALTLNPHLRCLFLCHEFNIDAIHLNIDLLKYINRMLRNLQQFKISIVRENDFGVEERDEKIIFEDLRTAIIEVSNVKVLNRFPIGFKRLNKLVMIFHDGLMNDALEFVAHNEGLAELELKAGHSQSYEISQMNFFETIQRMNCLRIISIEFSFQEFLNHETAIHLKKCHSLTKLHIRCWRNAQNEEYQAEDFQSKLKEFSGDLIDRCWKWRVQHHYEVKSILSHFTYPVEINESGEENRELLRVDLVFERKIL